MRLEGVSELARTENMTESMGAEENAQSGLNEDGEKVRSEERKRVERVPEMAGTNDATDSTEGDVFYIKVYLFQELFKLLKNVDFNVKTCNL